MAQKKAKSDIPLRRNCATMAAHMLLLEKYPAFRTNQMKLEGATAEQRDMGVLAKPKLCAVKTIVHVVYNKPEQNISDAQIKSQIDVLCKDFRASNPDRSKTPAQWKGLVADTMIEFKLAKVTRTQTSKSSFGSDEGVKKAATGGIAPITPKSHLNVWVCPLGEGLLGYAQFPGGPAATDGVVINFLAFGTSGTAQAPYNKGRTTTHEIGHYLNLRHIWGDTPDCTGSDQVADTPNCAGPNFGSPTGPIVTCNNGPHGGMWMNYMDYTDDASMYMFTPQQVLRMRTTLDTARSGLV